MTARPRSCGSMRDQSLLRLQDMKHLVSFVAVVALAACGGSKNSSTNPNDPSVAAGQADPAVDPTVPSWTPQSCKNYQKAVFQATKCDAIEQGKRDEIKSKYDTDAAAWKADQNVDDAKIAAVATECTATTESVRAAIGDKCVPPAQ
jgi:hypothetical protein